MDIQHLVDRLEDLIDEGRHVPLSKFTLIDEERALEIIDQMRISVPEQIEKASRLINQRDRLIAQANEEANRILQLARQRSDEMVERDAIVQKARAQAQNIIDEAYREAENIRAEADAYVLEVLRSLEEQLQYNLTVAQNGIAKLLRDREARQQPQQRSTPAPAKPSAAVSAVEEVEVPIQAPSQPGA
jgi:vacuolar-type H+-ATPase subunit H